MKHICRTGRCQQGGNITYLLLQVHFSKNMDWVKSNIYTSRRQVYSINTFQLLAVPYVVLNHIILAYYSSSSVIFPSSFWLMVAYKAQYILLSFREAEQLHKLLHPPVKFRQFLFLATIWQGIHSNAPQVSSCFLTEAGGDGMCSWH